MLGRKYKVSPDSALSFAAKGYSSGIYNKEVESMLRSGLVTRVYCGQQLRSVLADKQITE